MRNERMRRGGGKKINIPEFIARPLNSTHHVDMRVMKVAKLPNWPVCSVWAPF